MTPKKTIDFQKCNALPPVWCETVYPDDSYRNVKEKDWRNWSNSGNSWRQGRKVKADLMYVKIVFFLQNVAYKFMLEIGNIKVDTQNKN